MSNDLVPSKGNAVALSNDDYFAALAGEAEGLKGGGDGKAFLKFSGNDGRFSYGADDVELAAGTQLVMNPRSAKKGWVIWVASEVVYEKMVDFIDPHGPTKASLPDHGPYGEDDGPVEQYTMDFATLEEPFVEMIFQANNVSKRRAFAALLKEFGKLFRLHPGCYPIVEIDSNEFEAKGDDGKRKYKKYAPVFKIVDWIAEAELNAMAEGNPEDYEQDGEQQEAAQEVEQTPAPQAPAQPARRATPPRQAEQPKQAAAAPTPAATPAPAQPAKPAGTARRGRFS